MFWKIFFIILGLGIAVWVVLIVLDYTTDGPVRTPSERPIIEY